jgi:hypothetical protein
MRTQSLAIEPRWAFFCYSLDKEHINVTAARTFLRLVRVVEGSISVTFISHSRKHGII